MSEIDAWLAKAERSFTAAEQLLQSGDADFAVSRAYYGYFYVAEALLLSRNLRFSTHPTGIPFGHGQVIAQYGRLFAKTSLLDRRFHHAMRDAFNLRETADYAVDESVQADEAVVSDLIQTGREFLEAATTYLNSQ